MLIYGDVVPLSELSPGDWFVLMRRGHPDYEDSLEETDTPFNLRSVDDVCAVAHYQWRMKWYEQKMTPKQLVRRCDPTR